MNKIKFFIKDFWEDFRYMNEGSSPKYWVNIVIWYILMTLFLTSMVIAATLGGIIYNIKHR
jgi:hypothetical protein